MPGPGAVQRTGGTSRCSDQVQVTLVYSSLADIITGDGLLAGHCGLLVFRFTGYYVLTCLAFACIIFHIFNFSSGSNEWK